MNYFWWGIEYIFCLIDAVLLYAFSSKVLDKKENYKCPFYLVGCLTLSVLAFILTYIDMSSAWATMSIFSVLKIVIVLIMNLLYIFILFKGNFGKRIVCYIITIVLFVSTDVFSFIIVSSVRNVALGEMVFTSNVERLVGFFVSKIIFILLSVVIINSGFNNKSHLPLKHWIVFLFIYSILFIFACLIIHVGILSSSSSVMNIFLIALILFLLFICFCIYFLFIQMNKYYQKMNEKNMLDYQNELIEKYILQKEESDKIIRILSHDLKHNLLHWKQLAENKGYNDVLKGIMEYEQIHEEGQLIDVGNDIANAIVNQKLLLARKKEIQIDIKGVFSDGLLITSIDLCSLLGNLFDNAIEACVKVKDISKRKIFFSIKRDGNFQFIEAVNSYEVEPIIKDNVFITKKRNRLSHGIGMLSINAVVEKYEGAIENTFKDDEFKTIIMLRAYE